MNTEKSSQAFAAAKQLIPGGVNSPVRAFRAVGRDPLFIDHAKGSHIFDIDGNEYIDYVCSWGPCILGHAKDSVIEAVKAACERGLTYGAPTELETRLAQLIVEAMPAIERVRLVSSGTEAVMSAVRAARGFTGREKIIKFVGNYHGHSDGLLVKAGSGLMTESVPDSAGVPKGYAACTLTTEYNSREGVEALFAANKGEIAALIVEPLAANMGVVPPAPGFLQFLRDITKENGTVLIFDEVITGFRLAYGGACEYYGITPDLVTLGKIVGGGMPMAAYGGRADILACIAPTGNVYQAGTLSGNPIAVTAGIAQLEELKARKDEIYPKLAANAAKLAEAFRAKGMTVNQVGSLLSAFHTKEAVTDFNSASTADTEAYARDFRKLLEAGIYTAPSQFEAMFVSAAHTDEDIARTVEAIRSL